MCTYTNHQQTYKCLKYTGLLVLTCIIIGLPLRVSSAAEAQEINKIAGREYFIKFSDENVVSGDYSKVLKQLCENTEISAIHSHSYNRRIGRIKNGQESIQTQKARKLLKGLSKIAWSAMHDKMDSKTRLANIKQLVILEKHILKARPLGSGNIQIADSVSLLISALIFQEVADSDLNKLNRILPFTQREIFKTHYTNQALGAIFDREIDYRPAKTFNSQYDLLIGMIFDKYPEFANKHRNKKNLNVDSVVEYNLSSHKPQRDKSMNPLIDVEALSFASDFFTVRKVELWVRFSIPHRRLLENSEDKIKSYLQFKQELINGMTDFEKQLYGNPKSEVEVLQMVVQIGSQIRQNRKNKGKNILKLIHRRFLAFSEGNLR
ncbi:MAG: hypothetical protein GY774_28245 [Planctomycetes bacterium]|nr:hypothetical protein [Planctomycetota bacterium]